VGVKHFSLLQNVQTAPRGTSSFFVAGKVAVLGLDHPSLPISSKPRGSVLVELHLWLPPVPPWHVSGRTSFVICKPSPPPSYYKVAQPSLGLELFYEVFAHLHCIWTPVVISLFLKVSVFSIRLKGQW